MVQRLHLCWVDVGAEVVNVLGMEACNAFDLAYGEELCDAIMLFTARHLR